MIFAGAMARRWLAFALLASPSLALDARTMQDYPVGNSLELEPGQLAEFIATGVMPRLSAAQISDGASRDGEEDPEQIERSAQEKRAIETVHSMISYLQRLKVAEKHAEDARAYVLNKEDQLERDFKPSLAELERLIEAATTSAAKAEVRTMKERMLRMHYKQVASLDRQASFWEDRVIREREMRRDVDAKVEEQKHLRAVEIPGAYENAQREVTQVQAAEADRLHKWLRGFAVALKEEEDKVRANGTLEEVKELEAEIASHRNETVGWPRTTVDFVPSYHNKTIDWTLSHRSHTVSQL